MLAPSLPAKRPVARCAKRDRYCRGDFAGTAINGIGPVAHITDVRISSPCIWRKLSASCPISLSHPPQSVSPDRRLQYDECCHQAIHWRDQRGFNTEPDGEDAASTTIITPTRIHIAWL